MQICPELGHSVSLRGLLPEAELLGADDVRPSALRPRFAARAARRPVFRHGRP